MTTCDHCQSDARYHNFNSEIRSDRQIPLFCSCGENLVSKIEFKQYCGYCGDKQYYLTLRCPTDLAVNASFPLDMLNSIRLALRGKPLFGHKKYRGELQFKRHNR